MTRKGVELVMQILEGQYPQFYKNAGRDQRVTAIRLWHEMLKDYADEPVFAAVKSYIAADTKGFPPVVGQIIGKLQELMHPAELSEMEAWSKVRRAISNSAYHATEEWERLPEEVKRVVSPSDLRVWALADVEGIDTVVQSNFMRSYRARQQRAREYAVLPADVRAVLEGVGKRLSLEEKRGENA